MFDDKEPQDIFAETDKPQAQRPVSGIPVPTQPAAAPANIQRGPSPIIPILIVLIILGALGGGGYYLYISGKLPFLQKGGVAPVPEVNQVAAPEAPSNVPEQAPTNVSTPQPPANEAAPVTPPANEAPIVPTTNEAVTPTAPPTPPANVPLPTPILLDSDNDGLPDSEELTLGTDPYQADTDSDGLSDYDEVKKYLTNPLKPDTDGDGYMDGAEVKGGYDPLGPGKLVK